MSTKCCGQCALWSATPPWAHDNRLCVLKYITEKPGDTVLVNGVCLPSSATARDDSCDNFEFTDEIAAWVRDMGLPHVDQWTVREHVLFALRWGDID